MERHAKQLHVRASDREPGRARPLAGELVRMSPGLETPMEEAAPLQSEAERRPERRPASL